MTHEKALEILKENKERRIATIYVSCKVLAIEALEKQIPKKGTFKYLSSYTDDPPVFLCPCCQTVIHSEGSNIYKYCFNRGQALDWSETE